MKRYIQRIITGIIVSAMVFGNFAGMGVPVVKAAEDYTTLNVLVEDEQGNKVPGVRFCLKFDGTSSGYPDSIHVVDFGKSTDSDGRVSFDCAGLDTIVNEYERYEIQLAEGSSYELKNSPEIVWFEEGYVEDVCIGGIGTNRALYKGQDIKIVLKGSVGGTTQEPTAEDQFLEGVVKQNDSLVSEEIMLELSRVDLSGTPVEFKTNEKGEFKLKINDIQDGIYKLQPALGSGYTYAGGQPMRVEFDTRKENGQNIKYVSKVDGNAHSGGAITLPVVEDDSSVITGVTTGTKSVDEKGSKVTLTVTGRNLPDTLYYKKYYVKNDGKSKNDILLKTETAQQVPAKGETDREKTIEVSLPNALEYVGATDYSKVTAWKIGVDISSDGQFLARNKSNEIEIKKASIQQGGDSNKQDTSTKQDVKVSKITISGSSKNIAVGKKIKLTAKVSPANATNKAVKWKSSNKKYATVDAKGNVTVKKAGAGKTVTITATAADGSGKKASYKIKIMKNAVKSISLKANKSVKAGKSLKVKATVKTTGKNTNKTLKWTSSNTKYATVSAKGVVKTKKAGKNKKVKITAAATDGSNKKKTITIKIK